MIKHQKLDKLLWVFFICVLLLNFILLVNTKFTLWPEMMVYPYLLNNGFTLYEDLINPYPPMVTYSLAFIISHFNYSVTSYQLLTWILILLTTTLVFITSLKLFKNSNLAIASTVFFAFSSTLFGVNGLWFDLAQAPLILISVYYFAKFTVNSQYKNLDKAFLIATFAIFIKQQAVWLLIYYCATLILIYRNKAKYALMHISKTILFIIIATTIHLFFFYRQGIVLDFVDWVLLFPLKASSQAGYFSPPSIRQLLVVLATFGLYVPILIKGKKLEKILLYCAITLSLFSYPRFDYFHLVPSLAILAVIFGRNFNLVHKTKSVPKTITITCFIFIFAATCKYIATNWQKEVRFFESDIISSASILAITIPQGENVYIQNGPDQLLPLSGKLPPKPWADEFPWYLENSNIQERVISALESDRPTFIVYKPYDEQGKYMLGSYEPKKISKFLNINYSNYYQMSSVLWLKKRNIDL